MYAMLLYTPRTSSSLKEPIFVLWVGGGRQTSFPDSHSVMSEQVAQFEPMRCRSLLGGAGKKKEKLLFS